MFYADRRPRGHRSFLANDFSSSGKRYVRTTVGEGRRPKKKVGGYAFRWDRRKRRQTPSSGTQLTSYKNSRSSYLWVSSSHTDRLSVSKCWSVPTGAVDTGNGLACASLLRMAKVKPLQLGAALRSRKVACQIFISHAIQFPTSRRLTCFIGSHTNSLVRKALTTPRPLELFAHAILRSKSFAQDFAEIVQFPGRLSCYCNKTFEHARSVPQRSNIPATTRASEPFSLRRTFNHFFRLFL